MLAPVPYSPDLDVFSTPPTTPMTSEPPREPIIRPSLSRSASRPSNINTSHTAGDLKPDILLDSQSPRTIPSYKSPVQATIPQFVSTDGDSAASRHAVINGHPDPQVDSGDHDSRPAITTTDHTLKKWASVTSELASTAPVLRSHTHSQSPMTSPCFLHSNLDKGASLSEWLKTSNGLPARVDVAPILKPISADSHKAPPRRYRKLENGQLIPIPYEDDKEENVFDASEYEDDDGSASLTKQLAATAVGVREMSKQLGRTRIRSNIQNVLIVTKARDNRLIALTRALTLYLMKTPRYNGRGLVVYVDHQLRTSRRFDAAGLARDYPELFHPFPRRRSSSSNSLSSTSTVASSRDDSTQEEGQLRYWTTDMCSRSPNLFDFVVTLGGDGTVLFTSWLFQRIVPPVLSFALGSLGFLTNFDFADYQATMDSALESGIRVNLRMRFTCTVYRAVKHESGRGRRKAVKKAETGEIMMRNLEKGGWEAVECGYHADQMATGGRCGKDKEIMCFTTRPVESFEVLNDLVIDRGPSPYVSMLELFGDEHHMTTVQGDGLTISTPTGSTAYSLSAGGSLVHPEIPAILITPIAPHTLSFRPMLLPDSLEVRVCVPFNSRSTAWASFDGRGRVELKQGDHIKVTASKFPFPTVCADKQSTDWFHAISRTLKWNERERQKSFVVVEEGPAKEEHKHQQRKIPSEPTVSSSKGDGEARLEVPDEGDSDEEEEKFDIDDLSSDNSDSVVSASNSMDSISKLSSKTSSSSAAASRAAEAIMGMSPRVHAMERARSRSRSGVRSGVDSPNRFAPVPPRHGHGHVQWAASAPGRAGLAEGGTGDIGTPTTAGPPRRMRSRSPAALGIHSHQHPRTFAVWGQDESDSNSSDTDP
ncbi:ATP-NAD kinase [Russula earlei]|uniref:ATP-NAD kinase n=1 Tax=Russula earlei TaxID=71964 RepID=A0ACC0U3Q4_9AGAM|nr:ATP-NAD kinase [Russula earlei]